MKIWGINALNHDASITVVDSVTLEILFAGHAERYSRIKNDPNLNYGLIDDARHYGHPDLVVWHENPRGKKLRYLLSGQFSKLFDISPKEYLECFGITCPIEYSSHHESHAAAGFYTSKFYSAAVLVIDAIGEITTASIWHGEGPTLKKKWSLKYPNSIGLFYSAMTDLVGLKPNEEEYILMGMAAYGDSLAGGFLADYIVDSYFPSFPKPKQSINFHRGIRSDKFLNEFSQTVQGRFDLALAAQNITTSLVENLMHEAAARVDTNNLVYAGGVALNCVTNSQNADIFSNIWIMPNPGDAGNSLGAVANFIRHPLKWKTPFLGYDIDRPLDVDAIVKELQITGICGVANGRAEFGPRALGNRSLLADPRRTDIKDKVNQIKQRQMFRPFAPAVLQPFTRLHFDMPTGIIKSPYMQYVGHVRNPESFPAISHIDSTARVQTVDDQSPTLRAILSRWYDATGCPILLNTSLNIKGEPLVNTWADAARWQEAYGVKVF